MAKKDENINPLMGAIQELKSIAVGNPIVEQKVEKKVEKEIVDIITFCEDSRFLGFSGTNDDTKAIPQNTVVVEDINAAQIVMDNDPDMVIESNPGLYFAQRIILKCFYSGTVGNESLMLNQEEWEWLYAHQENEVRDDVEYEKSIKDVIRKMHQRIKDPKASYFKELHLALGRRATKCGAFDDRISTTEGSITYGELCDRINSNEKIGICTYDPNTLKRSTTYDIKLEDNGIVDCYTITTRRGVRETSSWNHPYLVWRKEWAKPQFIKISELLIGDKICTAEKTELFGKGGIGVKKAALLGHLQGDGGTTHHIGYTTACPVMLNDFESLIKSEFPNYKVKYRSKYDYCVVKTSERFSQNGSQKNEVKKWLKEIDCYGKKAIAKDIPECIYRGSKEEVSAFLSRLFGCDGWGHIAKVQKGHGGVPTSHIGYCSSSEKIIYGVRHLLQKFGIHATLLKSISECNGKKFDTWKLAITREPCLNIFKKEIGIFSKEKKVDLVIDAAKLRGQTKGEFESIPIGVWNYIKDVMIKQRLDYKDLVKEPNERLREQYSPSKIKIAKYGNRIKDEFLHNMGNSDVRWDEVKSIDFVGEKRTIAMEVKGTNIIGNDLVSHNTFLASIITAYEAYKLLVINKGNPHAYYRLPNDDEIAIINVALSEKQAGRLFAQIQSRIRNSPFFKDRIGKGNSSEIRLLTDSDIAKKKEGVQLDVYGSIIMLCGHSNPDSLAGYSAILILFDEIAFYDESGKVTGTYFYKRLKPSLAKFYKYGAARIIQISSPNTKSGIFYDTWNLAKTDDSILSFQLPSWDVNPDVPYDNAEMKRERESNLEMFKVEYGAQWAETGTVAKYFQDGLIERCIRGDISRHKRPMPNFNYYLHVDPAKKKNQYAAVLVAKERYAVRGQRRSRCFLAGTWVWKPVDGVGLIFSEIDRDILTICNVFQPISVTYDAYNSIQSLQFLRSHGVNTKELPFNNSNKAKFYQNLRDMMAFQPSPELFLYSDGELADILIAELKNLKMKQTKRGYNISTDKNAEVKTDDFSDALAGAVSQASEVLQYTGFPDMQLMRTTWA